ncbi:MAG: 16S rRNA (cytosine(967)-C(5))-methyltransferase RsmB [Verrucomicrobiota bacterium]|nr:16S rRNA (cytosine(967)-C(5))-methyltransferase RsmB [Verrucomicrobiota bacterium]
MSVSSARAVALEALREWRESRAFADAIIQRLLRHSPLGDADRHFAQELFYGVIRHLRRLDFFIAQLREGSIDPASRDLLRLGFYQLFHLTTPSHAAVFETVALAAPRSRALVNAILRSALRQHDHLAEKLRAATLGVRESHPDFLIERWREHWGDDATEALCLWNNQPAPLYVRLHTTKITREEFLSQNATARTVDAHPLFVHCETLPRDAIERGLCYVQDPSTALAVDLMGVKNSERVLDACAAPGGKTSYLATLTEAEVVATDFVETRLRRLQSNIDRLGLSNVRIEERDWLEARPATELFDKILVDVPCTNTGVARRRVDVRWRLQPGDFERMPREQLAIFAATLPSLRVGGEIVYSTCSLEREENEGVVGTILSAHPELELQTTRSAWPFRDGCDGAFAARFGRRR